ncbi:hypothetical protein [Micromonospora sp. DH14]|uniref:hypothetical protein n=1 Tax=Micromonospora sp. DH14 TaxID=3040120 RepID=UPI0024415201|nr:hypothetical protein [Micromonospora sp. DH14]MDG9677606.1 hypothetical protein [Micromonospora sp. DH14]
MERVAVQDYKILVLAEGETSSAAANAKGHLFESFIANLLHEFGFESPRKPNVNVTSDGIELDVSLVHLLTKEVAVAEGKAYSTNVKAQALTSFYGKLQMERFDEPKTHGFLFAIPRLVADGAEKAKAAERNDSKFHYFDAERIVGHLISRKLVRTESAALPGGLILSDPAIVISEEGLYSCVKSLDHESRRADRIFVWGRRAGDRVPTSVMELLRDSEYGSDLLVEEIENAFADARHVPAPRRPEASPPIVVAVRGSSSDFEYQFPASPDFFVGRRAIVSELERVLKVGKGAFVLNAQSGWGKSSLALKLQLMVSESGGSALVVDSRTASSPAFVAEALRIAAKAAESNGLLSLPADSSWASLQSAISTLNRTSWLRPQPLVVFFDQFENVFQDELITREFRDLAMVVQEVANPILVGFAWKTDLVGWTESHPYRLRDEIRAASTQIVVEPMGAKDIEALLRRLEKRVNQRLARDLRQRLREYSQGLPWLFKKLAEHVIREIEQRGKSQEQLVSEALNVQSLFDADLAGLQPVEQDAVRHVARFAPVSAAEITEKYDGAVIQSLLDRRLIVAVGEKLDTYWDTFRDFLNTGQIPIQDSYTIGLNPQAVAPLLAQVVASGGDMSVADVAGAIGSTPGSVVNSSRILRLLGVTMYEANRVRIADAVLDSGDRESALRRTVASALRRHRAYSLFVRLAERHGERVSIPLFTRELPEAFPAVEAQPKTWATYARAFALWFEYSGLSIIRTNDLYVPGEGYSGKGNLLSSKHVASVRVEHLHGAPGPSVQLLLTMDAAGVLYKDLGRAAQRAARGLLLLGLAQEHPKGTVVPAPGSVRDGSVNPGHIRAGLQRLPGGREAISVLERDPAADIFSIGAILRDACAAEWKDSTTQLNGKHFRSWAKAAGVRLVRARESALTSDGQVLFEY